jgi:hypothetical protein
MTQEEFDKMVEGTVNPSRIKVVVKGKFDFLMSATNTNDTMDWFKTNACRLEENLRKMGLNWAYTIETTPDDKPFIYMFISPTMNDSFARNLTQRAKRTLPQNRIMFTCGGLFETLNIDQYDNTPTTLIEEFLMKEGSTILRVDKI